MTSLPSDHRPPVSRWRRGLFWSPVVLLCGVGLFYLANPGIPEDPPKVAAEIETPETAQAEVVRNPLIHTVTVDLQDGQLDMGELLAAFGEASNLDSQTIRESVNWKIDVSSPAGKATLRMVRQFTRGIVTYDLSAEQITLTFDRLKLRAEEKRIRRTVLVLMQQIAPEAAAQAAAGYGIVVHQVDGTTAEPAAENLDDHVIVLVHGLDDPGKVWTVLAPELVEEGYITCEFFYPNDQAIADSSALLIQHLKALKQLGVSRVTFIAHSMGGLVSRWALTDKTGYGGEPRNHASLPDVERLIMVGTPNHGSEMARFRLAAEVREQIERALSGDGMLFGSIFDGTGEAKLDLLPDSAFLTELNGRPHPQSLPITIISGNTSPVTAEQLRQLKPVVQQNANPSTTKSAGDLMDSLAAVADGIGDGLVTLESARLKGVEDFLIVQGNHLTIIRNFTADSDRTPPAIPIILERLQSDSQPAP